MGKIIGGSSGPSSAQKAAAREAAAAQAAQLAELKKAESNKLAALNRKKRGRASLISGEDTGLSDTLG